MKFFDLTVQYQSIKKEIDAAVKRVLESGIFVGGPEVEALEKEIAKFCGVKYAIAVNSGTDALLLSLKALDIKQGDEVITTPFTFIATAEVIANLGAMPVFVDINPETYNIDAAQIEKKITKKTKAIIPVHLFGQMAEMNEIMKIARKYNLYVIEDACQAIGSKLKAQNSRPPCFATRSGQAKLPPAMLPACADLPARGAQAGAAGRRQAKRAGKTTAQNLKLKEKSQWQCAGTIGDCGCFSFFPSKNLGAYGDGGMVTTNNQQLADKIRLLRNHGSLPKDKYKNLILGVNSRLDALQAAILRVKLKYLNQWNQNRKKIAKKYNNAFQNISSLTIPNYQLPRPPCFAMRSGQAITNYQHIFHQYTLRCKNRNALKTYLDQRNIPTMIYYAIPLHLQPALKYLGYKKGDFPETEKAAKEVLSLPVYPELSIKEQGLIIQTIKKFYEEKK